MEGVSVVCARSAHQSVVRRDLTCFMGGHSGVPVVLLFLRAQNVTLMFISVTCMFGVLKRHVRMFETPC